MPSPRRIAAIGSGGFLMDDESGRQERRLLSLTRPESRSRPSVLFAGTAGGDSERGQLKYFRTFNRLDRRPACLPFFLCDMKRGYRQAVHSAAGMPLLARPT